MQEMLASAIQLRFPGAHVKLVSFIKPTRFYEDEPDVVYEFTTPLS